MVKRSYHDIEDASRASAEEELARALKVRARHFFPTASRDSFSTDMATATTVEYSSNAPNPLPSLSQNRYPRLAAHNLLPDGTPDYLRLILTAKVYDVVRETPLAPAPNLSAKLGNKIYLKREDLQDVFSFKIRGAYNFMASLSEDERWKGVVTCSAGVYVIVYRTVCFRYSSTRSSIQETTRRASRCRDVN